VSTKYLLPCSCGEKIPVRSTQAGETVRCACGAELEVPTMQEVTLLQKAEPAPDAGHARSATSWGRREGWMLFGTILLIVSLGFAGYLQWSMPRFREVDTLTPLGTWVLWQELRLGANRDPSPVAKMFAERLAANRHWLKVNLVLAGVGVLITAGAFAVHKRR